MILSEPRSIDDMTQGFTPLQVKYVMYMLATLGVSRSIDPVLLSERIRNGQFRREKRERDSKIVRKARQYSRNPTQKTLEELRSLCAEYEELYR